MAFHKWQPEDYRLLGQSDAEPPAPGDEVDIDKQGANPSLVLTFYRKLLKMWRSSVVLVCVMKPTDRIVTLILGKVEGTVHIIDIPKHNTYFLMKCYKLKEYSFSLYSISPSGQSHGRLRQGDRL
jgi:hypothetical protein